MTLILVIHCSPFKRDCLCSCHIEMCHIHLCDATDNSQLPTDVCLFTCWNVCDMEYTHVCDTLQYAHVSYTLDKHTHVLVHTSVHLVSNFFDRQLKKGRGWYFRTVIWPSRGYLSWRKSVRRPYQTRRRPNHPLDCG